MITLTASSAALLAVFAGGWLMVALWATLRGRRTALHAATLRRDLARLNGLLGSGPAVPLVIRRDGSLEAGERLAAMLGVAEMPRRFSDLVTDRGPFAAADAALL